ncbi:hypothetical protein ACWDR6_31240, partial [Streptomyces ardesiacus]
PGEHPRRGGQRGGGRRDLADAGTGRADGLGLAEPPLEGSGWLLPPGEADLATDPAVLRAALGEAARLIRAADSCR